MTTRMLTLSKMQELTDLQVKRYEEWQTEWIQAYIWWCGDEHCDCSEPHIDHVTPNRKAGYPWINRKNLWAGTFETDGEGRESQAVELKQAADRFGIQLDEEHYGRCVVTQT